MQAKVKWGKVVLGGVDIMQGTMTIGVGATSCFVGTGLLFCGAILRKTPVAVPDPTENLNEDRYLKVAIVTALVKNVGANLCTFGGGAGEILGGSLCWSGWQAVCNGFSNLKAALAKDAVNDSATLTTELKQNKK